MKEKINHKKREITLIIIISMVILFFFSGFSLGKGVNKTNVNAKVEIAKPILEVENNSAVDIKTTEDKGEYEFIVKNYDEIGNITQVDLEYNIEILSTINENISIKIYKENQEINLENQKTEKFLLTKESKQEHQYKIEIMYNGDIGSIQELIQDIQIKVHSEQKKA